MEKIKNKKIEFIVLIALVIILSVSLVVVLITKDKGISMEDVYTSCCFKSTNNRKLL